MAGGKDIFTVIRIYSILVKAEERFSFQLYNIIK